MSKNDMTPSGAARRAFLPALGLPLLLPRLALAQAFPAKPIRVVVPNTAGSLIDVLTRIALPGVAQALGGNLFVDNRAGAAQGMGTDAVAKAAPDGYTLLAGDIGGMTINPAIYSKLPYDPLKDFAPVSLLGKTSYVLVVNPNLGVKTLQQFVALAKSKPKQINYSSGGNGHPQHMLMEIFQQYAGTELFHVPYKGGPAAMQALLAGDVGANIVGLVDAEPHIKSGGIIALAIGGPQSKGVFSDLPNLAAVYPGFDYAPWFAMFAPAGTPPGIIERLDGAIVKALAQPDVKGKLAERGITSQGSTPAELDQLVRADTVRNRELAKRIGLKID